MKIIWKRLTANIVEEIFFKNEDRSGSESHCNWNEIKEAFFGEMDPIGEYIKIDNEKFRVIGVLEKQENF